MEWERTEVDGVPTCWSGLGGELEAGLVFRVGYADEQLARCGITHLVEHLVLHEVGRRQYHDNGEVEPTLTTFSVRGSEQEIVDFLAGVCRAVTCLPTHQLAAQNEIVRREAGRWRTAPELLAAWRYGATGYGLVGHDEFGIGHHTPRELGQWTDSWFTRGNAALWISGGQPPAGLRLDLPDGPRFPPPWPTSVLPHLPAYFESNVGGVAASTVIDRGPESGVYLYALRQRLLERLPDLTVTAASFDERLAEISVHADWASSESVNAFVEIFDELVHQPPTLSDVGVVRDMIRAGLQDPRLARAIPRAAAHTELFGGPARTVEEQLSRLAALSPEQLATVAVEARDAVLLMLPFDHAPPGDHYPPASNASEGVVEGPVYTPLESSGWRRRRPGAGGVRLCVGPSGVSLVEGGIFTTVRFDECEVMVSWPDGARQLIGRDGIGVLVEPTLWRGGQALPALLDEGVPAALVISRPPRRPDEIPDPGHVSVWDRLRTGLRRT
ncbi:hypothetical protein [Actinophytocola sediminis]